RVRAVRLVGDDARVARAHRRAVRCRVGEGDRARRTRTAGEGPAEHLVSEVGALDDDVHAGAAGRARLGAEQVARTDDLRRDRLAQWGRPRCADQRRTSTSSIRTTREPRPGGDGRRAIAAAVATTALLVRRANRARASADGPSQPVRATGMIAAGKLKLFKNL